jgi:hypothetical protein
VKIFQGQTVPFSIFLLTEAAVAGYNSTRSAIDCQKDADFLEAYLVIEKILPFLL